LLKSSSIRAPRDAEKFNVSMNASISRTGDAGDGRPGLKSLDGYGAELGSMGAGGACSGQPFSRNHSRFLSTSGCCGFGLVSSRGSQLAPVLPPGITNRVGQGLSGSLESSMR
jgi:hypothetical protein